MKYYFNKLGIFIAAIGILLVGFIFVWFKYVNIFNSGQGPGSETKNTLITPAQKMKADLLVDFGNGRNLSYSQTVLNPGETALSLLLSKMEETNSEVTTKKYDTGTMVLSIDNVNSSDKYFWLYYVNGQAGNVASDKYILKDGDIVEWKYTPVQK